MEKLKLLSGDEIVVKGATKIEVTLPEIGLKDVKPDGSWLEKKQIQSALEARKHLLEVPRIEKSGVLSHAEWQDELRLAEVTQQCGGYWQFLGHHRDKKLYLRPEEALFLMEVNCLLLKFSGVTVSLQQAYSLLLSDDISIIQYKVYASLSRLGYKVFRHAKPEDKNTCQVHQETVDKTVIGTGGNTGNKLAVEIEENKLKENESNPTIVENVNLEHEEYKNKPSTKKTDNNEMEIETQTVSESEKNKSKEIGNTDVEMMDIDNTNLNLRASSDVLQNNTCLSNQEHANDTSNDNITVSEAGSPSQTNNSANMNPLRRYCQWKLQKLKSRQEKSCKTKDIHKHFENCPDILNNQIISIKVPKEEFIPKNIFLNNLCYVLNVENVRKKNNTPVPSESAYSLSDEVNGAHIRRVTDSVVYNRPNTQTQPNAIPDFFQNFRPNIPFRHFGYFRPRANSHYFQFNLFYQRSFMGNFNPRFQFYPRMHMPMFPGYTSNITNSLNNNDSTANSGQNRRKHSPKTLHFEAIKNLAVRLRQLSYTENMRPANIQALQRIINTYNERYRQRLRLTEEYEVVNDETIVDTIELDDDDEESRAKKPRLTDKSDSVPENLSKIRQIAFKLKTLEAQNKTSARHRRALSSLIKTFNKSFNADIYMNDNFEVLDRRHINLDSDSDSDCVVEVSPVVTGKKLRNPFNILKRLSEKQVGSPSRRRQDSAESSSQSDQSPHNLYDVLEKVFKKPWLPNKDDFGRPEVIPRDTMNARIIETKKEEYLLDFYKNQSFKYTNWVHIKTAFLENIEDTNAILHTEAMMDTNIDLRSLVRPDDCTDMSAVLNKLRIIKSNKDIKEDSTLTIDFDVYNRDVQNFRKANKPKPHFRIVCIDENTACPRGVDIATLHSNYKDNVTILFAVVGMGSISYLQMNPSDLPVYIPCNDLG